MKIMDFDFGVFGRALAKRIFASVRRHRKNTKQKTPR